MQTEDGACHAFHQDEQGSTAYVTGQDNSVGNIYRYDAFGSLLEQKESITNRILYTGQQYDQETGQYYLRARYYNPVVGRFLQEDTYRGDGLNLYAYCANNPVMYFDPSGHTTTTAPTCGEGTNKKPENVKGDKTNRGREYTDHGAQRANERGFDSEKIDNIIDNNYKNRVKEIDPLTGKITWRYQDKRGNTVITNEWGDKIVTVYSYPEHVNDSNYIPK